MSAYPEGLYAGDYCYKEDMRDAIVAAHTFLYFTERLGQAEAKPDIFAATHEPVEPSAPEGEKP